MLHALIPHADRSAHRPATDHIHSDLALQYGENAAFQIQNHILLEIILQKRTHQQGQLIMTT